MKNSTNVTKMIKCICITRKPVGEFHEGWVITLHIPLAQIIDPPRACNLHILQCRYTKNRLGALQYFGLISQNVGLIRIPTAPPGLQRGR